MSGIIRVCKKCNIVKNLELFKKTKLSYRYTCIDCYRAYEKIKNKKYYAKNKELLKSKYPLREPTQDEIIERKKKRKEYNKKYYERKKKLKELEKNK